MKTKEEIEKINNDTQRIREIRKEIESLDDKKSQVKVNVAYLDRLVNLARDLKEYAIEQKLDYVRGTKEGMLLDKAIYLVGVIMAIED